MNRRQKQKKLNRIIPLVKAGAFVLLTNKEADLLESAVSAFHQGKFDREFAPKIADYFMDGTFPRKINEFFKEAEKETLEHFDLTLKQTNAFREYFTKKRGVKQ